MILSWIAFLLAFVIGLGRQITVFTRFRLGLWLFRHFKTKRIIFSLLSTVLIFAALLRKDPGAFIIVISALSLFLLAFAFFFDMDYFFPEVREVKKRSVNRVRIDPDEQIIGVVVEGTPVAYPLEKVVIPRHLINDRIAGIPVLISFCALCQSALAFKARLGDEDLYFKVGGVWRRNMFVIDQNNFSFWQQSTGECFYGPDKGKNLEFLSGENTNLGSWIKRHPKSQYAFECHEARKGYFSRSNMNKILNFITPKIIVPGYTDLSGLPPQSVVFGITHKGESLAIPKDSLHGQISFSETVGGEEINFEYDEEGDFLRAFKNSDEQASVPVEKHWWLGWKEFHPQTSIKEFQ